MPHHDLPPDEPTDGGGPPSGRFPGDPELEALLREQPLHTLPLALVSQILDEVLPVTPTRPLVVLGRVAAAVVVFFASWFAVSGEAPALADGIPQARVVAALPDSLPQAAAVPSAWTPPAVASGDPQAAPFLLVGLLVFVAGLLGAWWLAARAPARSTR